MDDKINGVGLRSSSSPMFFCGNNTSPDTNVPYISSAAGQPDETIKGFNNSYAGTNRTRCNSTNYTQHAITSNGIFSNLSNALEDEKPYDLICVGFGPASLSIAVALHDRNLSCSQRVLFLERQPHFAWHAGMLLPGSRMQISFIKDLATLRNPQSRFTFLNYLHEKGRLVTFTNLGTFLPLREEFNDYLTWCAGHFEDIVRYGETVLGVDPFKLSTGGTVSNFTIASLDATGVLRTRIARHVVIAVGGQPYIPKPFPKEYERCIHSSGYSAAVPRVLSSPSAKYKIAVIGGGQSAAEIFSDLHSRYPNCQTKLIIKGQSLRPSDDSPFVNEIFNPEKVSETYALDSQTRAESIDSDKATNYGVVRLELLERIYEHFYSQRLHEPDPQKWQHQILPLREVTSTSHSVDKITLRLRHIRTGVEEEDTYDAVIVATGYVRNIHKKLLTNAKQLLRIDKKTGCACWGVSRDYKLQFDQEKVSPDTGVWLQGCCESTHGLSDTLLSILAVRSGELVDSIFGPSPSSNSNQTPSKSQNLTATIDSPPPTPSNSTTPRGATPISSRKPTSLPDPKVMVPEIVPTDSPSPLVGVPNGA